MTTHPPEPKPRRKWHLTKWLVLLIVATFAYAQWRAYLFRSALKEAEALGWVANYTKPLNLIYDDWGNAFKKDTWRDGVQGIAVSTGEDLEGHRDLIQQLNPKRFTIENSQTLRDLSALKGHTRLKVLHIKSAPSLTNLDALQNLTALEQIGISGAAALTNVDGFNNMLTLKMVILADAKELTNVDALKNLPAMEYLQLRNCTVLSNVDGLKNCKTLQTVYLVDCPALTNVDGLKNLPALTELWLSGCAGLAKESIEALRATLPKTNVYINRVVLTPQAEPAEHPARRAGY